MEDFCYRMEDTDLLVFSSPIYFNGCSSIMKRFIDRLNPYWGSDRRHPRYCCGLLDGGSPEPEFSHARSEMVSASNTVGMEWLGELCIGGTDRNGIDEGRVRAFAKDILSRIS